MENVGVLSVDENIGHRPSWLYRNSPYAVVAGQGHDAAGLDSDLFAACTFAGKVVELPLVSRDLRDFIGLNDAVERLGGFDAVIHLAGLSNDRLATIGPR
jgi:nucleoside-diphosphate-sugar epimerase